MKRILAGWLLVLGLSAPASAQSYNVALIPDSLKKDARAVLREDEIILEIKSPGKAIEKEHHVYTILNEAADDFGGYASRYSKLQSINWINGTLYDASGKEVKHVKTKDMADRSYTSEENLVDDARLKTHNFYCRVYLYTVDYEEEDEMAGILGFTDWVPLRHPGVS